MEEHQHMWTHVPSCNLTLTCIARTKINFWLARYCPPKNRELDQVCFCLLHWEYWKILRSTWPFSMYNCSKLARILQFHGDHSTCTQPARIQEASHHKCIVMRNMTLSLQSCASQWQRSITGGIIMCVHTWYKRKSISRWMNTGRTHRYYAWTTWCHFFFWISGRSA